MTRNTPSASAPLAISGAPYALIMITWLPVVDDQHAGRRGLAVDDPRTLACVRHDEPQWFEAVFHINPHHVAPALGEGSLQDARQIQSRPLVLLRRSRLAD